MASVVSATLSMGFNWSCVDSSVALNPLNLSQNYQKSLKWLNGAVADTINALYVGNRNVVAGTPDVIDLASSTLLDPAKNPCAFARICAILGFNNDAANTLLIGGGSSPILDWVGTSTDTIAVPPLSPFVLVNRTLAAYVVTSGSAHNLQIVNSGSGTANYDIFIPGRNT